MLIQTSHNTLELGITAERLLSELEVNFPQFLPQPNESSNAIMYKSGQRSVVEWVSNRILNEEL